ncbi:MAG: glycosyltransferase family 2 protein [Ferruginibacter sp.]
MTIVISMAGLSQRFIKAGFTLPKYMLYAGNKSLFNLAVGSFSHYFKECRFLFIARGLFDTERFIVEECKLLGISDYEVVILDTPTQGQAETVYLGLNKSNTQDDEPVTIFNIDTFRPGFRFPGMIKDWDGYLEVFYGEGPNWSYAKTASATSTKVIETAEKIQISNYCSTGLYYFKSSSLFMEAFMSGNQISPDNNSKELYVAPLYNSLIAKNKNIHIHLIEQSDVLFCGIPAEYYDYLKRTIKELPY